MQITETSTDGLKREFQVVIAAADIDGKVQAKLQELSRTVKLPGFRPGKVPLAVVTQRFGGSVVHEIVEHAIDDSTKQALTERGLRLASEPRFTVTPYQAGHDLEFTLGVEIMPDIEPPEFGAIALERPVAEVADQEVENMLVKLASFSGASEPVTEDRGAAAGDLLVIDYAGTVDGEAHPGMSATDHPLTLGQSAFLPDFELALEGARAGEHRQLTVTFPADYHAAELAGRQAVFEVDVRELRSPIAPVVDDALAQRFGMQDVAALRASARARLAEEYGTLSRRRLKRALLDQLAGRHTFPVPPTLVEVEFNGLMDQFQREREAGRLSAADQARDDEAVRADYRNIAERRVRLGLLLSDIGRRNNIKVTQEEVNRAVVAHARNYPGQERAVLDMFRKNEELLERMRAPLYEEKIVDFILELVRITDHPVSIEELRRDPDEESGAAAA